MKFSTTAAGPVLVCPVPGCSNEQVHFQYADVSGRKNEDGPVTEVRVFAAGKVEVNSELTDFTAQPGRRNAVALVFTCEWGHTFSACFLQHKGDTLITEMHTIQ